MGTQGREVVNPPSWRQASVAMADFIAATIVEKRISGQVFFALGATYLYNFVFHVFFGGLRSARLPDGDGTNFAPGNAGVIFYVDIIVPLVGFVLLALQRRYAPSAASLRPCSSRRLAMQPAATAES